MQNDKLTPRSAAKGSVSRPVSDHGDLPRTADGPTLAAVLTVGRAPCTFSTGQTVLPTSGHRYEVVSLGRDPDVAALSDLLVSAPPRLVVADIRWCEEVGTEALRHLRQLSPATSWLVCWSRPEPQWLPILLDCGALGAMSCDDSPQDRLRALDAVYAGQLWLPRKVLQWLYARLLDSGFAGQRSLDAAARLTPRETEVMDLMHQGLSNSQIGERLGVSVNTIKKHLSNGFEKLGIHRRRQMLA